MKAGREELKNKNIRLTEDKQLKGRSSACFGSTYTKRQK